MQPDKALLDTIRARLDDAQRILVVSHIRPDGDAVGSLLGLGLALQAVGKDVQMVLSDGLPVNFAHLEGGQQVRMQANGVFDFIIAVDCSEPKRIGDALNGYSKPDLNIDHHFTNSNFARYNLVIDDAVATAEILALYLSNLGLPLTSPVANALLTGLVADTIGFRTSNVKPGTLRTAAALMEAGGDLAGMYYPALVARSFQAARYWGAGLSRLQREDCLVWTSLFLADRQMAGYSKDDDADLVNILSAIEGMDVAIIFVEQAPERVKISWRLCGQAPAEIDVSQVAEQFGGGGHRAAAGAELDGSMEDVQAKVLEATRSVLGSQ
jgi:phosphoesterase RecJ-like protein